MINESSDYWNPWTPGAQGFAEKHCEKFIGKLFHEKLLYQGFAT